MYFEALITLLQTLTIYKCCFFVRQTLLLEYVNSTTNVENLQQCKIKFSLVTEQVLVFALHPNMVSEVKNLSPNFKQIV